MTAVLSYPEETEGSLASKPIEFPGMIKLFWYTSVLSCFLNLTLLFSHATAVEITAVGDISISQRIINERSNDLDGIKLSGDIVFANFEGVLSPDHRRCDTLKLKLTMPPAAADTLKKIGFNTLSLANNHVLDLGPQHYRGSREELNRNGFRVAGLDDRGTVIIVNDLPVRFAAFSFTGGNNVNDPGAAAALIRSLPEDIIIVSAHMGGEGRTAYRIPKGMEFFGDEKRGDVVQFAHACIDAGADLVLGHGPHILRGMELYKNKLIVYSLGNFIFDYPGVENHTSAPAFSISVRLTPEGDFQIAAITSYRLRQGVPVPDQNQGACRAIQRLSETNLQDGQLSFTEDCHVFKKGGNML